MKLNIYFQLILLINFGFIINFAGAGAEVLSSELPSSYDFHQKEPFNTFKSQDESSELEILRQKLRQKLLKYKHEVMEAFDFSISSTDTLTTSEMKDETLFEMEEEETDDLDHLVEQSTVTRIDDRHLRRRKRATITADNPLLLARRRRKIQTRASNEGSYVLRSVFRVSPQYFDHVKTFDINAIVIQNQTFMFTLELTTTGRTEIAVYIVGTSLNPKEVTRMESQGATSLEVIQIEKHYYILPLVYNWTANNSVESMDVGSNLYKIDLVRRKLIKVQTIRTAYARTSVFWKGSGEEANDIYLAVAPEFRDSSRGRRFHVQVPYYRWQGGYFDYVSSVSANNPQAIRHFNIFSHDYLAVANYQDDSGSTNIHSEVFKYYHKESRFISFQRIRTYGAKDIQHFSFQREQRVEHFLAIANHCHKDENGRPDFRVKSVIMKFASQRFIPFKSFYTYGALQFLPVTLEDKFYLVLAEMRKIRIFQYNGWSFVQTYMTPIPEIGSAFYTIRLRPFIYENQPFFGLSSVAEEFPGGIYSIQFDQKNDYNRLTSDLEKWCLSARNRMNQVNVTKLEEEVDKAPKTTDRELFLSQPLTFSGPLTVSKVFTHKLTYGGRDFDEKLALLLQKEQNQLEGIQTNVSELQERIDNVVFRNQNHVISGKIQFAKVDYYNPELVTGDANFGTLNGRNVESFLKNVIFTNKDLEFQTLRIDKIMMQGNLKTKKLNGTPLSDYALKIGNRKDLLFTKKNTFNEESTLSGSVTIKGLLSGVDFNQPNFLLASGNQTFQGLVKIRNSTVTHLYTKQLNGNDVGYYRKHAVPLHGDAQITGSKTFRNVTVENLKINGMINGFDLNQLYSDAIYLTGKESQSFTGTTFFQLLETQQLNVKNKLINGKYNLSKDFVNVNEGIYRLGDVILTEDSFVSQLNVTHKLNNFDVKNGELEILLTDSPSVQRIKNKRLSGVHFEMDVEAEGLVDGVNLREWTASRRILLRNNNLYRKVTIHGNLSAPRVKVNREFIQGTENILPILKHIAPLNSKRLPGSCILLFDSLTVQGNSEVRKEVNGHKPSSWILKDHPGSYEVTGRKNFLGQLTLEEDCKAKALYASIDPAAENILKVIPNLLINGTEQTIEGTVAFTNLLQVERLDCPQVILGGIPFENLLLTKGYQEIEVESHFENIVKVYQQLEVKADLSLHSINYINLTESINDTLRTGRNLVTQVIQGEYQLEAGLTLKDMETDGHVGQMDLGQIFSSIVRRDRKEPLFLNQGSLTFKNGVTFENVQFSGELNGISESEWGQLWLISGGNQTVYTPVEFLGDLHLHSALSVDSGFVGPLDVMKMSREIIQKNHGGHLGHVEFEGGLTVIQGISMAQQGTLNGLDLRKDVLLKNEDPESEQVIVTGEKTFENGWTIHKSGNLTTTKLDDVDIPTFLKFVFNKNPKAFTSDTLIIQGDLLLKYEPNITGFINELSLNKLTHNVWFTDKNVVLKYRPTFNELNLTAGGQFSKKNGLLSGVNLDELSSSYVSKTKNQTWTGNVTIEQGVTFDKLKVKNLLIRRGYLNDIDLDEFQKSILMNGTDEVLNGKFNIHQLHANHISLQRGLQINELDLIKDFMTLHGLNNVTGRKIFDNLEVGELVLRSDTLLGGINLTDWAHHSLKIDGENSIEGPLLIHNLEDSKDISVGGKVDGVIVDKDHILLKNGSQVIEGKMTLNVKEADQPNTAALTAPEIIVDGLFNSYDLNKTFSNLVRKSDYEEDGSPIIIEGEKKFLSPIHVDYIRAEKLYQGLNMSKLLGDFYSGLRIPPNMTFRAKDHYEALSQFAEQVLHVSTKRAVFLEYFVYSQEIIQENVVYSKVLYGTRTTTLVLGFQESELKVQENWWAYSLSTDYYQRQLGNKIRIHGKVVDSDEIDMENYVHFIIISVSSLKNRPAAIALEVQRSATNSDINKGPGKLSKTFILRTLANGNSVVTQTVHAKDFGPLETFYVTEESETTRPCVLVTSLDVSSSKGDVLCLQEDSIFSPYQILPLENPFLTTSMEGMNRTLLMIANKKKIDEENQGLQGVVEVWVHSDGMDKFFKESCIPVYNPVSMDAVFGTNRNLFLVVASGSVSSTGVKYLGSVFIYKYSLEKKEFEKSQTLEIDFPLEVRLLRTDPSTEVLLFILTQNRMNNVLVYKFQGLSGWNLKAKWTSEGGKSLEVSDFTLERVYKAQVLVTSSNATRIYTAQFKGLEADRYAPVEDEVDEDFYLESLSP